MTGKKFAAIFLGLVFAALPVSSQEMTSAETESQVPELVAMHDIIYPIWHTAYPEKDLEALKSFVPRINELADAVSAAELPGILRDKAAKWEEGVAELKKAVAAYNAAAKGSDGQALLDAAEVLHARYEGLVRTIRPVLKEMDEFHKALYIVFHKSLPDKKWDDIRTAAPELKAKAEAVTKAQLSSRLESKAEAFKTAAARLLETAAALEKTSRGNDAAATEEAVLKLHTAYQNLEKIFD